MLLLYAEEARRYVNSQCAALEPWQIIVITLLSTLGAVWLKGFLFQQESKSRAIDHYMLQDAFELMSYR